MMNYKEPNKQTDITTVAFNRFSLGSDKPIIMYRNGTTLKSQIIEGTSFNLERWMVGLHMSSPPTLPDLARSSQNSPSGSKSVNFLAPSSKFSHFFFLNPIKATREVPWSPQHVSKTFAANFLCIRSFQVMNKKAFATRN